jgi:hypothetical protein
MGSVVAASIGFVVLAAAFQNQGDLVLGWVGAVAYLFGGVLVVAAEALSSAVDFEKLLPIVHICVILAFLSQVVLGGAILQSRLAAPWVGGDSAALTARTLLPHPGYRYAVIDRDRAVGPIITRWHIRRLADV